jgi:hypothetical protein
MSTLNVGRINCTGSGVRLPSLSPANFPIGESGLLVYNSTTNKTNVFTGTAWEVVGGVGGSNTQVQFNNNGQLGASANLVFDGNNLTCGGNIIANSDKKLKDNIVTIANALDKVSALRGVEYDRNDMNGQHQIGVIAQEVEKIIPEVVFDNNGIKSVSYGNLVAVLIEAIKELKDEVDSLRG